MYRIGIDLGGTNIAAGVVDEGQHIVAEVSLPTGAERPAEAVVADICRAAEKAMEKAGITAAHCASVGIGSPGTCDSANGVVVRAYNLGWFNVPVCSMVTARLGLPCRLSNDANCAALAETVAGGAVGCRNMILITLGTGVGGGIIIGCYVIGLILSCLLYLFLWLKFVEHAAWKAIIIIEVFMAALILGVFVFWMQVQFPVGLFAYLM